MNRRRGVQIEAFRWVDWRPFRTAFPLLFGGRRIISLDAGAGWRFLLWNLCLSLEAYARAQVANGEQPVRIVQIKQKFGGLRFYLDDGDQATRAMVAAAEEVAEVTCEACGAPAKPKRINGWISTFCRVHQEVALDWAIRQLNKDL